MPFDTPGQQSNPFAVEEIVLKAVRAAYGSPVVTNVWRGQLVEAMVATALAPEWDWCGADYKSWDFERADGLKLEVKQSSAKQTWKTIKPSKAIFDVAARSWSYGDDGWSPLSGRAAQLYVLARHEGYDDTTDHRDATQWDFYVIAASDLPVTAKTVSLSRIAQSVEPVRIDGLKKRVQLVAQAVESCAHQLPDVTPG
ncbi:hypothetical protein [Sphingomonas sp. 3-13AW]|uniref:hypothetical protein n=1 Tax=Sphingomonas sp. 3-13AW TaxID=3050450 RepID=UPI003BB4FA68